MSLILLLSMILTVDSYLVYDKVWEQGSISRITAWKNSGGHKIRSNGMYRGSQTSGWVARTFWYMTIYDLMCFVGVILTGMWIFRVFWPICAVTFSQYNFTGEEKWNNVAFYWLARHPQIFVWVRTIRKYTIETIWMSFELWFWPPIPKLGIIVYFVTFPNIADVF